jgi:hypothetical protein
LDLESLLRPIPVPVFLDRYFGQSFLHVPGSPEKFSTLAPSPAGDLPSPLAILAQDLERALEAPVRVNLPGPSTLHCRERDGLLLQIDGQSDCAIHTPAGEPADNAPVWEGVLQPGDTLYIPRGWWLNAAPGGLRVTFDIENPTGADLLMWLVGHVKLQPAFQSDVPRFADPATRAEYMTGLRKALGQYFRRSGLFEAFRRESNFNAVPQDGSGIPWSASTPADHWIAFLTPRKIRIKRADGGTILLVAIGKRLAFPEEVAPLLHFLSQRAPLPAEEFYQTFEADFSRPELSDLLSVLSKGGIIGSRKPDSF